MMKVAPHGSIEINGMSSPLYGFKELYEWGVKNGELPDIKFDELSPVKNDIKVKKDE